MRQRVALVRTLATDPGLLLLDEPFSALDYQIKLQLEDLVSETLMRRGTTAILVTHDLSEAIAVSSRVILLQPNPGRIRRILRFRKRFAAPRRCMRGTCRASRSFFTRYGRKWSWQGGKKCEYRSAAP